MTATPRVAARAPSRRDRLLEPKDAADLGRLDPDAIERVKAEAWPEVGKHDELHDALVVHGFLTAPEIEPWKAQLTRLRDERRVVFHDGLWVAVERSAEFERAKAGDLEALAEILRSRLELVGPVTEPRSRVVLDLPASQIRAAPARRSRPKARSCAADSAAGARKSGASGGC